MSNKSNLRKSPRRGQKLKKKLKKDPDQTEIRPESENVPHPSSSSSSASGSDEERVKEDAQDDQSTNLVDQPTTQSFADRLKILNLQTGSSNGPLEENSDDSNDDSNNDDQQEAQNGGLANKMVKRSRSGKAAQGSLGDQIHSTDTLPKMIPIQSLAQTLTQALKSSDQKLLESCFLHQSKNDKHLIANTVQRLPQTLIHNLIEQIVICLNRKKRGHGDGATVAAVRRTKTLIEWVRQILFIHMSYLLTIPTLVSQLNRLHASLQKRLNLHTKLLSLNGRLELVLNQIEQSKISSRSNGPPSSKQTKVKPTKLKSQTAPVSKNEPFKYVEGESSASDQEPGNSKEEDSSSDSNENDDDDDDDDESDRIVASDTEEDEGSIEDVVLRSGSDDDESEDSDEENEKGGKIRMKKLTNGIHDFLDLEAEESRSENDEEDSEDDEDEDEDEEDDSLDGFIDDGTEESSQADEQDTDSE